MLASFPPPSPTTPPHLPLLMKSFQSLFPPLSPHTLSLSSARRVVLISYNADRGTVDFRHYIIKVKPYGVSKRVRRVLEAATSSSKGASGVLDLGNEKDVADFLLRKRGEAGPDGGYESAASSTESVAGDDGDAVDLAEDYVGRNNKKGQRRAVRLDEVGPRMELRLIKITEGVPGKEGAVMYHEFGACRFLPPCFMISYVREQSKNQRKRFWLRKLNMRPKQNSRRKEERNKKGMSSGRRKQTPRMEALTRTKTRNWTMKVRKKMLTRTKTVLGYGMTKKISVMMKMRKKWYQKLKRAQKTSVQPKRLKSERRNVSGLLLLDDFGVYIIILQKDFMMITTVKQADKG